MKTKRVLLLVIIILLLILLTSCANVGLYDGKELRDSQGREYRLDYQYNGYYFLEVKDSTGTYVPDNRFERLKK